MPETLRGSCLCGEVQFETWGPFQGFNLCHCSRCRKSTGSAHASNLFTAPENIRWLQGGEQVRRYDLPTAERFARCFCGNCGSPLPYLRRDGVALIIPAGCLDETPPLVPGATIFWPDRADWYEAGLQAPHFDTYPE